MKWYSVYFKGGDEERPHEETMGVQANSLEHAKEVAFAKMRDDFHIRYPEIYDIFLMVNQP